MLLDGITFADRKHLLADLAANFMAQHGYTRDIKDLLPTGWEFAITPETEGAWEKRYLFRFEDSGAQAAIVHSHERPALVPPRRPKGTAHIRVLRGVVELYDEHANVTAVLTPGSGNHQIPEGTVYAARFLGTFVSMVEVGMEPGLLPAVKWPPKEWRHNQWADGPANTAS